MPEILKKLKRLKRRDLVIMAGEFEPPVKIAKNSTAIDIAERIRERQKLDELKDPQQIDPEQKPNIEGELPPDENFETLLDGEQGGDDEPPVERRGGVREGSGRPEGMTDRLAMVNRVTSLKQPNPAIVEMLKGAFGVWSMSMKIDEIALTQDEAVELALPYTQLMMLYCPNLISDTLHIWLMTLFTTFNIIKCKIDIIKIARGWKNERSGDKNSVRETGQRENGQGSESGKVEAAGSLL